MLSFRLLNPPSSFWLHPVKKKKIRRASHFPWRHLKEEKDSLLLLHNPSRKQKNEQGFMNSAHINIYCSGSSLAISMLLIEMGSFSGRMWVKPCRKSDSLPSSFPPTSSLLIRGQCWAGLHGCRALPLSAWLPCLFLLYWCAQLFFFPLACAMLGSQLLSPAYRIHRQKALRQRSIKMNSSFVCT